MRTLMAALPMKTMMITEKGQVITRTTTCRQYCQQSLSGLHALDVLFESLNA
jgi:hypothetical protein